MALAPNSLAAWKTTPSAGAGSNTTRLPAKVYANVGVAPAIFFESDEVCETSCKGRGSKYQG